MPVQPPKRATGVVTIRTPNIAKSALVLTIVPPCTGCEALTAPARGSPGLKTGPAQEARGGDRHTVDHLHGHPRESPRRGPPDDATGVLRVELGLMAWTPESGRLGLPEGDVASGVRAHAGVGDDALGGPPAGLFGEVGRGQAHEQQLVEGRSIAHRPVRIHRKGRDGWAADRDIGDLDHLPGLVTSPEHESVAVLRALTLGIALGGGLGYRAGAQV